MAKRFNSRTRVFEAYTKGLWDRGEMADTLSGPDDIDTVDAWIRGQEFRSTTEVKIPERLVDR